IMTRFASGTPRPMAASLSTRLVLPLVVSAGLTASFSSPAADKTPAAAPRTAILTPAQLKECVTQKERLSAQTDDALKDKAAIEADKTEIARTGTSLSEELTTLD